MRSKTSKPTPTRPSPWRVESNCSEADLGLIAQELARELRPGDRVLLEGPLGAGKSTLARALLEALGAHQPAEGSPTFAIAHEYSSPRGGIVHIDFYRLKSEMEIEEAGISSYFWERPLIVLAEWTSMHSSFQEALMRPDPEHRNWIIQLAFVESQADRRALRIDRTE